ncbi:MAG: nucleotidyltransferase domain-containing protein, partial [Actinobacteria bacterium]|nr:nucleotidyltransferase domain-containing protein [Actinomycetota bacterium]
METNIEEIKKKILPILKDYRVKKIGLFGSYARGEIKENSDIDILIEIE